MPLISPGLYQPNSPIVELPTNITADLQAAITAGTIATPATVNTQIAAKLADDSLASVADINNATDISNTVTWNPAWVATNPAYLSKKIYKNNRHVYGYVLIYLPGITGVTLSNLFPSSDGTVAELLQGLPAPVAGWFGVAHALYTDAEVSFMPRQAAMAFISGSSLVTRAGKVSTATVIPSYLQCSFNYISAS